MKKPLLLDFKTVADPRGGLSFLEELKDIPFEVKRVYWIKDIPEQQVRGDHAHKIEEQVIICLNGKAQIMLESKEGELFECELSKSNEGLYIPAMWWSKMIFSQDATLLGLSSREFTEEDYIRKRQDF